MSMTKQLWSAILLSTLLALSGSLLSSLLSARGYLSEQLTLKNADNATALALSLSHAGIDDVTTELSVSALFDSGQYELIRITTPRGKSVVERTAEHRSAEVPEWFRNLLPIDAEPGTAQISDGWKQYGVVTLRSESGFAYAALWRSAIQMVFATFVAGLIGCYLGSLILRRLLPPLRQVVDQAKGITERRFLAIPIPRVPELAQLAEAMNQMVARLKSMFDDEAARLESVRREANFDALTGLANRAYFLGRLAQAISGEREGGSLLLLRVANLAEVNRELGRAPTDALVQRVASFVQQSSEAHADAFPARLGGADFALLLPAGIPMEVAAEGLLENVRKALADFGLDIANAAHIGVAPFRAGGVVGDVLAEADAALASAVSTGHASVAVSRMPLQTDQPKSMVEWETKLNTALDSKWLRLGAFPVIDPAGQLIHQECPLRLRFEQDGDWLPAGRFIPMAERLGLTARLDLAAVELGLSRLEQESGTRGIAINLAAQSISDTEFQRELLALIKQHARAAERLWLEIPEGGALMNVDTLRDICRQLAPLGCRVGVEHFGREFSQIGRFHNVGIHYVKVDASFIHGIDTNTGNQAFLSGLCHISKSIGFKVFAEGVETGPEQLCLRELGFDGLTGPAVKEPA